MGCASPVTGSKLSIVWPAKSHQQTPSRRPVCVWRIVGRALFPGLEDYAKPGIAKAIGIGGAILLPQEHPRYAACQSPWNRDPVFSHKREPLFWGGEGHAGQRPISRSWSGLHSLIGRG